MKHRLRRLWLRYLRWAAWKNTYVPRKDVARMHQGITEYLAEHARRDA